MQRESVDDYMRRAKRGEAGVDGETASRARSGDRDAQRAMQAKLTQNERQATLNQREEARRQEEAQKATMKAQKEQEKARMESLKEAEARNLRRAKASGAVVEQDVETGKNRISRHADGTAKFTTGKQGAPEKRDGKWTQAFRNDRGEVRHDEIKGETVKTRSAAQEKGLEVGDQYFERKDEFGKSVIEKIGRDDRLHKLNAISVEQEKISLAKSRVDVERSAFDEQWKPALKAYEDAEKEHAKIFDSPRFRMEEGKWVTSDGGPVFDDAELAEWRKSAENAKKSLAVSKAKKDELEPTHRGLSEAASKIEAKKNKLMEDEALVSLGVDSKALSNDFARSQMVERGMGEELERLDRENTERFVSFLNPLAKNRPENMPPISPEIGEIMTVPENAKLLWGEDAPEVIRMFRLGME